MTSPYPPGLARARRGLQSHQERGVVVVALGFGRRRRPRGVELGRRHDVVEQRRVLAANFTIIRGRRTPLDSVANPEEVRAALANSRHAWMLEEKDMFDRLKSTHAHSPPPKDP